MQGERRDTWGELEDRAARLAGALAANGVGPGTHVALYLFNCPEYAEVVFACLKLRAVPANVNFRYLGDELVALLANADAKCSCTTRRSPIGWQRRPRCSRSCGCSSASTTAPTKSTGRPARSRASRAPSSTAASSPRTTRAEDPARRPRPLALVHGRHHRVAQGRDLGTGHAARKYRLAYISALLDRPTPTTAQEVATAASSSTTGASSSRSHHAPGPRNRGVPVAHDLVLRRRSRCCPADGSTATRSAV
jgi:hypothetical protein